MKFCLTLAGLFFVVTFAFGMYIGYGVLRQNTLNKAHHNWRAIEGHIVKNYYSYGTSKTPIDHGTVAYRNWQGQLRTVAVQLNGSPRIGNAVYLETSRHGQTYVPADVNAPHNNPLIPPLGTVEGKGWVIGLFGGAFGAIAVFLITSIPLTALYYRRHPRTKEKVDAVEE